MPTAKYEVRFWGSSDDRFEIDGAVRDEAFKIEDPSGQRINLVASYGQHNTGMWMLGFQTIDDGDKWPDWNIRWGMAKNEYSPELVISDLPEGTTITRMYPKPENCDECGRPKDAEKWTVKWTVGRVVHSVFNSVRPSVRCVWRRYQRLRQIHERQE